MRRKVDRLGPKIIPCLPNLVNFSGLMHFQVTAFATSKKGGKKYVPRQLQCLAHPSKSQFSTDRRFPAGISRAPAHLSFALTAAW